MPCIKLHHAAEEPRNGQYLCNLSLQEPMLLRSKLRIGYSTAFRCGHVHARAGWAVDEKAKRRGFMEDIRVGCELAVTSVFEAVRVVVRRVLALPNRSAWSPIPRSPRGPSARRRTRSEDPGVFTEVSALAAMPYESVAMDHSTYRQREKGRVPPEV